jgi:hypothetical protein
MTIKIYGSYIFESDNFRYNALYSIVESRLSGLWLQKF